MADGPTQFFSPQTSNPFLPARTSPPKIRMARPGFPRVIQALHVAWQEKRQELEKQAEQIAQSIARIHTTRAVSEKVGEDLLGKAIDHIETRFDSLNGGLGTAPKFPPITRSTCC